MAGLGLFLVVAAPSPERADGSEVPLALCVAASLVLSLAAVLVSRREGARHGALVLGLADVVAVGADRHGAAGRPDRGGSGAR